MKQAEAVAVDPSMTSSSVTVAAEEDDRDKRRRRRRNPRRPKQNTGGEFSSMEGATAENGAPVAVSSGLQFSGTAKPFNSLPNMHISSGLIGPSPMIPAPPTGNSSRSCPLLNSNKMGPLNTEKKRWFAPYWSEQEVEEAIGNGQAFKATFRVNAHNRLEAYCTVEGLPVDILINGGTAQNRAIEGDVVALTLDPVSCWTKLKGQNLPVTSVNVSDANASLEVREPGINKYSKKVQVDADHSRKFCGSEDGFSVDKENCSPEHHNLHGVVENGYGITNIPCNRQNYQDKANGGGTPAQVRALERIHAMLSQYPLKRPTGKVVSIIRKSRRREAIIGFLSVILPHPLDENEVHERLSGKQLSEKKKNRTPLSDKGYVQLIPSDSKFPSMLISFGDLPECLTERVCSGDFTVEKELIAARIGEWSEECLHPQAKIVDILGRGGEVEAQIAAIKFENAIVAANFSSGSLADLPDISWKIPSDEIRKRKDFRDVCTYTIDPSSAVDLDDALSVEFVSDEVLRVGVHIADVSYFVAPDTALDTEAQFRSTSVYILRHKVPLLPPRLTEDLGSLIPGEDRLAFSITWDIDPCGKVLHRWIGRSVIRSCCKLSYEFVQKVIDKLLDDSQLSASGDSSPQLFGSFNWKDVFKSIDCLYEVSRKLRESRLKDGALSLDNSKLVFLFDDCGTPCDSFLNERMESCSLVEEFMLLANRSIAEIISRAFPDCALLRRHPEPNMRKLKEFEAFCSKHGFELDTSSSGQLHLSLSRIREKLKDDPVLFDILVNYASKPMQSATYFCTGDLKDMESDWAHYALSVPLYTHFTSPLRRYPDIIVQRTLLAALDAEETYLKSHLPKESVLYAVKCFTGLCFDKSIPLSEEGREALLTAARKFRVPQTEVLAEVAAYCNERNSASRHAEEAGEKLYLWALLKAKEVLVSEARILGLGPRFMSIFIRKFGIERRIYYDDVAAISVEWFETTSTLVLDLLRVKHEGMRRNSGNLRAIEDVALLTDPSDVLKPGDDPSAAATELAALTLESPCPSTKNKHDPAVFPLTLRLLSSIPVALHAVGGDDGPIDIGVRLYMSSYYR